MVQQVTNTSIEEGNVLNINKPDESADIVLLMGPMYHLTDIENRLKALNEAKRVLKKKWDISVCRNNKIWFNAMGAFGIWGK